MTQSTIHVLEGKLVAERLRTIEELASELDGIDQPPNEIIVRLALLHSALTAVRDVIATQQPHVGTGGEPPLQ